VLWYVLPLTTIRLFLANVPIKIWNLLEDGNLFKPFKGGHLKDEIHFAEMVSLIGPPPKQFLQRSDQCGKYWDAEGESTNSNGPASLIANSTLGRQLDCCDQYT